VFVEILLKPLTTNPCTHSGKPDWCYSSDEPSVCNCDQPPTTCWETTSKADKDGKTYYTHPPEKKATRPRQTRYWEYPARDGSPLVRVVRFNDGKGGKRNWPQERWGQHKKQISWYVGIERVIASEDIPIYRLAEVTKAIANNELINDLPN